MLCIKKYKHIPLLLCKLTRSFLYTYTHMVSVEMILFRYRHQVKYIVPIDFIITILVSFSWLPDKCFS